MALKVAIVLKAIAILRRATVLKGRKVQDGEHMYFL